LGQIDAELAAAVAQVSQAAEERQRLEAEIRDAEGRHHRLAAEFESERTRLQNAIEALAQQHRLEVNSLAQEAADRKQLRTLLDERESRLHRLDAERKVALTQLDQAAAIRRQLEDRLAEAEQRHRQLVVEHESECARLQQALEALAQQLQVELRNAREAAEQRQKNEAVELEQVLTHRFEAERIGLQAQLDEALASRRQLQESAAELEARHQRVTAEYARLEQVIRDLSSQHQQEVHARAREAEQQFLERQSQLDGALEEQRTLRSLLEQRDASHQESVAGHIAERARLEQLAAAAEAAREKFAKAAADREVMLSALAEHARRLSPLATAGRIALDLAPQLMEAADRVNALADRVLAECQLDNPSRADVERIRAEAIRANALADELVQATVDPDAPPTTGDRRGRAEGRR
jgi:hypothetical protein